MSKVLKQLFKEELEQAGRKGSHLRLLPPPPPPPDLGRFGQRNKKKSNFYPVRLFFLFTLFLCTAGYSYWLITEGRKIEKSEFHLGKIKIRRPIVLNASSVKPQDASDEEELLIQNATHSLNREGLDQYRKRHYADSAVIFARSVEIDPRNPYSLINFGMAKTKLREYRSAKEILNKAGKILGSGTPMSGAPRLEVVFNNLGVIQVEEKVFGPAILNFQRAIQLKPEYLDARLNLAKVFELSGRPIDAAREYQETLDLPGLNPGIKPALEKRVTKLNAFLGYLKEEEAAEKDELPTLDEDELE